MEKSLAQFLQGPMQAPIFETTVVSEWVKAFYHRGESSKLYYWRSTHLASNQIWVIYR